MRSFDSVKLRYHKVILMTDADVDGFSYPHHFLLTFFFRHMPKLITEQPPFIAQPPVVPPSKPTKRNVDLLRPGTGRGSERN